MLADPDIEVSLARRPHVGFEAPDAEGERQRIRRPEQEGVSADAGAVRGDHDRGLLAHLPHYFPYVIRVEKRQVGREDEQRRGSAVHGPAASFLEGRVEAPTLLPEGRGAALSCLPEDDPVRAHDADVLHSRPAKRRHDAAHHVQGEPGPGARVQDRLEPALCPGQVFDGHYREDAHSSAQSATSPAPNPRTSRARRARSGTSRMTAPVASTRIPRASIPRRSPSSTSSMTMPSTSPSYIRATPAGEISWPRVASILSAGPLSARPPTMGLTATLGAGEEASASRIPGTARIGPMLTTGLEGQNTTRSAPASASRTASVGRASPMPRKRMPSTSSLWRLRTKYSWNSSGPSGVYRTVATGSSHMGRMGLLTPR